MSCFVGHPVAAKPDRAPSRSGWAGTLYNLQPAEAFILQPATEEMCREGGGG